MKLLPKIKISDDLESQISEIMKISGLRKAEVIREALRTGLPQLAACFQPMPRSLEDRVREALSERPERVSLIRFAKNMKALTPRKLM